MCVLDNENKFLLVVCKIKRNPKIKEYRYEKVYDSRLSPFRTHLFWGTIIWDSNPRPIH